MKKVSNDISCSKLLLKKSSGHLKISIIMFLISITITMTIGLLYAKQYFQYEKDFLNNVAISTVYVDATFDENSVHSMCPTDIDNISQKLDSAFSNEPISVIPVYTCMGISINGEPVSIFAIDKKQCYFVGLAEMLDNTAYFTRTQPNTIALEISITEETEEGFCSGEMKRLLLNSSSGVSEKTPILTSQNNYLTPSMKENPICFVSIETFRDILSILLSKDIRNIHEEIDDNGLVTLSGIYVYVDDLRLVSSVSSFLTTQNYRAYAPTDSFDNFSETVSVTFLVFLLSAIILLCMTTANIFLSFRSFYRVQQRDMGILRYMGFNEKNVYKMYCRNLRNKFLQIMFMSSFFILTIGVPLFRFEHWRVLFYFILGLFAFLCCIYFAIAKLIISNYSKQDLLFLIRESKEFE